MFRGKAEQGQGQDRTGQELEQDRRRAGQGWKSGQCSDSAEVCSVGMGLKTNFMAGLRAGRPLSVTEQDLERGLVSDSGQD